MDVAMGVFDMALIVAAVVILPTRLNRRDRRASRQRHTVLDQLARPELRGLRVDPSTRHSTYKWRDTHEILVADLH